MKRPSIAIVLALTLANRANAQVRSWPYSECDTVRCRLWLEGDRLSLGGPEGRAIAVGNGLTTPVALSRFVSGDSAHRYALRYERDKRWSLRLTTIGSVVAFTSAMAMIARPAVPPPMRNRLTLWNGGAFVGGMAIRTLAIPLEHRADWNATFALAWHNRAIR